MEKESRSSSASTKEKVGTPIRRASKTSAEQNLSDYESGRGTGKSSGSTPQTSDSTSGIEMKCGIPSSVPYVFELKIDSGTTSSDTEAVLIKSPERSPPKDKSPKRSPKRSPVKTVKEGLRRMRDSLSPKKSEAGDESAKIPKEGAGAAKSPEKSKGKSIFRRKSRSPGKKEKRYSSESEPFMLGDELGQYSSSDEDQKATDKDSGATVSKEKHHKRRKSKERSPKSSRDEGYRRMEDLGGDDTSKASREKARKALKLQLQKEQKKTKEDAVPFSSQLSQEGPKKETKLLPLEEAEIGKWSPVRMTTDEEDYTRSPSETEMDLDSLTSPKGDAAAEKAFPTSDETEREVSSTGERISKHLDLVDKEEISEDVSGLKEKEDTTEGASSSQAKRTPVKRQMEVEDVEMRDLPDPGAPAPKKLPKCAEGDVDKNEPKPDSENDPKVKK